MRKKLARSTGSIFGSTTANREPRGSNENPFGVTPSSANQYTTPRNPATAARRA